MKYGIISDVHSNLEALVSVKASLEKDGAEEVFFLGDAVGYCANPNEVTELLAGWVQICLAGNHDMAVVGLTEISYFNPYAQQAILWTASQLSPGNWDFLRSLPYQAQKGDYTYVHASPKDPAEWNYILSGLEAHRNFLYMETGVCFIGHSHSPLAFIQDKDRIAVTGCVKLTLEREKKYIINVGSVGQPRDGNPLAAYALLDSQSRTVEIKRIPYDTALAQRKMRQANLPSYLIERLSWGH